jgi:hypothetical protein
MRAATEQDWNAVGEQTRDESRSEQPFDVVVWISLQLPRARGDGLSHISALLQGLLCEHPEWGQSAEQYNATEWIRQRKNRRLSSRHFIATQRTAYSEQHTATADSNRRQQQEAAGGGGGTGAGGCSHSIAEARTSLSV